MAQVFHIRTVNGSAIPVPKKLVIVQNDIDKDSFRTASGKLARNKIGTKMKFFLTFPPMYKQELQALLNILNSDKFIVEYEDIFTGNVVSGEFYHSSEISTEPRQIKSEDNTNVLYDEFSINLIEY